MTAPDPAETGYRPEERLARLETGLGLLTIQVGRMETAVDRLETAVQGRPSWLAATLISFSTMANGALIAACVALVTTRK